MKVEDLMTKDVVAVRSETSLKEVAALLGEHGFSGVPVVDAEGRVLGVVSEHDILAKERGGGTRRRGFLAWLSEWEGVELEAKLAACTAGEAMTSPAVTVHADAHVSRAAALMFDRDVDRLPVLGGDDRLAGIVTRADMIRAFTRSDREIDREIREDVLLRGFGLSPDDVDVVVENGAVTLRGEVESRGIAESLEVVVSHVLGVVSVSSDLHAEHSPLRV